MSTHLRDSRLDDYMGNFDAIADDIAEGISYEFFDVPSLQEIQDELLPKMKKSAIQIGSQAADWTIVSSFKMGTEAIIGKTAAGNNLSGKERILYGASVSLTALSYALGGYAAYSGDPSYAIIGSKTYAGSRGFFLAAKSKQTLNALHDFANTHNIQSLKRLLKKYDDIFANASDKQLEEIDKKIHQ